MSKISGKETKPEVLVRKYLFLNGFRYRKNVKSMPGSPDIVLPKYKTIVFVHGCFWHGHKECKRSKLPASNKEFWKNKISATQKRDKVTNQKLVKFGWKIISVWQCELENNQDRQIRLSKLIDEINNNKA